MKLRTVIYSIFCMWVCLICERAAVMPLVVIFLFFGAILNNIGESPYNYPPEL